MLLLPCFSQNLPPFSLFLPTLCDFLTVERMDVGRQQRTAAVLGLQHAEPWIVSAGAWIRA